MARYSLLSSVAFALLAYFAWQQRSILDPFLPSFLTTSLHDIRAGLRPKLSPDAAIHLPTDEDYGTASQRWQARAAPQYQAYVEPANEADVQAIVKYANERKIPFLAVSGSHGSATGMQGANGGIGISMHKFNKMELSTNGESAQLGGGLKNGEVGRFLASKGKRTVTGAECVGLMGMALGGGHGILQGRYGLPADQIVDLRVVLADGTAVTAAADQNPDLFWAMRGAGHNFGIVTEYTYKVYDIPAETEWTVMTFIFTGDKVEEFYREVNLMTKDGTDMGNRPAGMTEFSLFLTLPDIDPVQPVIVFNILYDGPEADVAAFAAPFRALSPIFTDIKSVPYNQLFTAIGFSEDAPACQKGLRFQTIPISVQKYDIAAQRAVFDHFSGFLKDNREFNRSWVVFEGYPLQGVRSIEDGSTSASDRGRNYITATALQYWSPENDEVASKAGSEIQQLLFKASGEKDLHFYMNYHRGDESTEELYGHDEARVRRLRELKKRYDPHGRLSLYAPIR